MKIAPSGIPALPGVYLFKNQSGVVIYIGKALSLKVRILSYFRATVDWKINALLKDAADVAYIVTPTHEDALILEAKLIQEYKPRYNVLFKEGQPFLYILFTDAAIAEIKTVRIKKDRGIYFGPFLHKTQARNVANYLIKTFRLSVCNVKSKNGCLRYHLGLCSGTCIDYFDVQDHQFRIQLALNVLENNKKAFLALLEKQIDEYNKNQMFEKSRQLNEYMNHFETIFATIAANKQAESHADAVAAIISPMATELNQISRLSTDLQLLFQSEEPIVTIDCFDISHFQSKSIVGSCIRFKNGIPDKSLFRRFAVKSLIRQNDYAALQEVVTRRYKKDQFPDLVVIDGGKGQLSSVRQVIPRARCVSIAKREELLYSNLHPDGIHLDVKTMVGKALLSLRDYAHHFAVSYHRLKERKKITHGSI